MTALAILFIVLAGLVTLVWLTRHILLSAEHGRDSVLLADRYAEAEPELPFLSVVVAAKDEEDNIEACVRSMLEQDYPDFEMIVVDDRSDDRTAEIVEAIAAEDPRLRLIRVEHLPEGWCGKNHAMQKGITAARGDWLCLIDADCRQTSGRSLRTAAAYAVENNTDLLSVLPRLELHSFWEHVVQPVCSGLMMVWFTPEKVNDPRRPHAYANGAFMLFRRGAYERIGTHEAVRDQVNEDMHMAARVKWAGLKLRVMRNDGLYTVRMYSSLKQILRGWSRIFYGTFGTLRRLTASLVLLIVMGLTPYAAAAFGWIAWALGAEPAGLMLACAIVGTVAVAAQISVMLRWFPLCNARAELGWTYLLGCGVATVALVQAMGKLRRGAAVTWRNTTYRKNGQ
jgi:cellulose synthase/poly-beta-1,6-N-acetylglucosamine synthase-like glycosyltransferase